MTSSANHGSESNSLEGLNLERGDSNYKARCVEQLDNQVSSLHQDVAALSVEVNRYLYYLKLYGYTNIANIIIKSRSAIATEIKIADTMQIARSSNVQNMMCINDI